MNKLLLPLSAFVLLLSLLSCQSEQKNKDDQPLYFPYLSQADSLAHAFIITDGHVDLPYRLRVKGSEVQREYVERGGGTKDGDFDYIRAKRGGLDAPFMSIYLPASLQKNEGRSK